MTKALIFDSSAIITLALNDLLYILEPLKKKFKGEFYIAPSVKQEIIDKPLTEKRFMLEALFIKKLLEKNVLTHYYNSAIQKEEERILETANTTFHSDRGAVKILHSGEASCLALFKEIDADKKAIVIDERTTRMLCEAPWNLKRLLENKLHARIDSKVDNYASFQDFNLIRSSELALMAFKLGIIDLPGKKDEVLEALLYASRFKGCAISSKEIEEAKNIF